jgi:DNA polymerase-3 subunit epsilon
LATYEILKAQLDKYEDVENDINFLSEYSTFKKRADFAGFIQFDEDENEIFTFGKYKGQKVAEILRKDKGYFSWIQNADFPLYTKKVLTEIREKVFPRKKENTLDDLQNKFNQKL